MLDKLERKLYYRRVDMVVVVVEEVLVGSSTMGMLGSKFGSRLVDMVQELAVEVQVVRVVRARQVVQELQEVQVGHLGLMVLVVQGHLVGQLDRVVVVVEVVVLRSMLVDRQEHMH